MMTTTLTPHVLAIDDDAAMRQLIGDYLGENDLRVTTVATGADMEKLLAEQAIDVVVLDLRRAGEDGMQLAKQLRETSEIPIIIVSGRKDEADRVMALELGADDYLTKPVHPRVLVARINAILRRITALDRALAGENTLTFGKLRIAGDLREVQQDGKAVGLTSGEFDLLWLLAKNAGKTLTRAEILKSLRSLDYDRIDRSVDNRIYRLRKKLGNTASPVQRIKSVRALGYVFSPVGQ
jgi:two-component system OmpR family response regulator